MKLTSIRMCNFRSFYGKSPEISFSSDEIKNTTFIHGGNGVGKTSFSNAFTWVLYEKFSAAFSEPQQLVNQRATLDLEIGQAAECWVEVCFTHEGKKYRVKRECRAYRNPDEVEVGKTRLLMQIAGEDGRWYFPSQPAEDIINQILPGSLHQYFFFDGERIEKIVRPDKKAEIAEATKMLLGVEVINRSIKHLGEAKKSLESELKVVGDAQIVKLLQKQTKVQFEIERLKERQLEIIQELDYQNTFKKETSNRLFELSAAKELADRKEVLENQKASYQEKLRKAKENSKKLISTRSYSVMLSNQTAQFRNIVDNLKQTGNLTAGISREFVHNLLNANKCICGVDLHEGTHERANIEYLLDKAGSSSLEEATIRMSAQVDEIDKMAIAFWSDINKEQARVTELKQNLSQVEDELYHLQEKLRQAPDEEIRGLQKRFDEIEAKITELTLEQGRNQQLLENCKPELEALNKQIAKQKSNEAKQYLAQRRIAATQDAIDRLTEVKIRQEKHFRMQLESRLQEIFASITFTPYTPKITDKFELVLVHNIGGVEMSVPASTGENQILCLSFISAIIDRVREWSEKKKMMMLPDSFNLPIVMDSPFGSLDSIYRRRIAQVIPTIANQLIVLASTTQSRGEVIGELQHRIGKEYAVTYYSTKEKCEEDSIELYGKVYPLIKRSPNGLEYTEITEVVRS